MASAFVVGVEIERDSFYIRRMVTFALVYFGLIFVVFGTALTPELRLRDRKMSRAMAGRSLSKGRGDSPRPFSLVR